MDREKVLSVENISKTFPGVKALNNISLDLYKGEVLVLAEAARAFGREPVYESCLSTSDANYLQDHGIAAITMGPGANEYGVHGVNEYVPVDVYLESIARYAYFLSKQ